ncbi:class I SAM-dependent methyltransferase [Streptomyces sp. TP-A0874]|uniref:class I SAM-dependent methyltransferase n=1 Tax=Streptomyces sp. TP-A0874 TaxID=549819 RepID=UPI000852E887|nr:class I SAM-dependent methyltransferase [Streptomyces sp. TP-A0874]
MTNTDFTPALGRFAPVRFYDAVVGAVTRERVWRGLLVARVAPRAGELVVDVGCGTGTLALLLKRAQPEGRFIGVDPDPRVLARARRKSAGVDVEWRVGMGAGLATMPEAGTVDAVVSSLVLHQCPMAVKRAILTSMFAVLRPGGRLVIADYGLQRTRLSRLAFRLVQFADGVRDTQPNADGVLPELISEAGFQDVREDDVLRTVTGSISLYTARRAGRRGNPGEIPTTAGPLPALSGNDLEQSSFTVNSAFSRCTGS